MFLRSALSVHMNNKIFQTQVNTAGQTWIPLGPQWKGKS